jgi:hypothetical protein
MMTALKAVRRKRSSLTANAAKNAQLITESTVNSLPGVAKDCIF